MADFLLNKVINEEISSKLLIKWILKAIPENQEEYKDLAAYNVGQIDFVTYLLNFIHEEVVCCNKILDTTQELSSSKRVDEKQIQKQTELNNLANNASESNVFITQPFPVQYENASFDRGLDQSIGNFSTPKLINPHPGNKNDSYFSPISPLYQNSIQNNFHAKDTQQANGNRQSANKYSLCLGDFLVKSSKSSSKKKKQSAEQEGPKKETSRRIKPTRICPKEPNSAFQKCENSFNFQENAEEGPVKTAVEQRNILIEERIKIVSRKENIEQNNCPTVFKRHNSLSKSDINPMYKMVTFKNNINHVVHIYKTILDHKLVLNITSEIYFLISLLLTRQFGDSQQNSRVLSLELSNLGVSYLDSTENSEKLTDASLHNLEIFESIHNIVYFAVKCLESQLKVLKFYDKTTIRLLAENERIKDFSPALAKNLLLYATKKAEKQCIGIDTPISQTNVCFNIDTDNKDNFIDRLAFQAFNKQRDLFYEILRIWEAHHLATDWNFASQLGGKVRSLFNFHASPTNYIHLARLFKNQLLSSCAKGPKEKGLSENKVPFLPSFAIDAEKLSRLTHRLVTKQSSSGINSLPVFSGYQEFFKDFIIVASNHFFNRHFCDILTSDIIELNDTKFSDMILEEEENEVDQNTRKLYVNCVKNMRILAKFLGFVESLPYQSDALTLPKNVLEIQIKLREQSIPSLNIKSLLQSAIEKHTVALIIPWVTKYLAMLDYVTLRLPYYTSVHLMLFDLYQNYDAPESSNNAAVVQFSLGWLFELPHFPDVHYFNFCSEVPDSKGQSQECLNGSKVKSKSKYLDHLSIVDQSVLYLCCPYLEEIKKVLSTNASGSQVSVKYITPVTAVESNVEISRKKLEQQLEEAFFSAQPTSLRKTVEFISERIASTAVKHICHDLVPKAKQVAIRDLKENLLKNDVAENYVDLYQRKSALRKHASVLAQPHLTAFIQTCDAEIVKIACQKIPSAVDSLLPVDAMEESKNVCIGIAEKIYMERVKHWINSHVNLSVFTKDFDIEIKKKIGNFKRIDKEAASFLLPSAGRDCSHNENSLSGFHVLNNIREACCKVSENDAITAEYVLNVLQETYNSLTQRNDVNDRISASISMTIFDFCLLLVVGYPSLFSLTNCDLTNNFLKIWSYQPKSNSMFNALLCPRNIKMLQSSNKKHETWDLYALIVANLLNKKLIEEDDLESQCTGFYDRDWSRETLESFSHFLRNLVKYRNNFNSANNKFAYLLDFLSDFCSDL